MRKYDHSSLDPAADTVGRQTFSTLAAAGAALAGEAVCVLVEWTESNTAASSSLTSSVLYVHSGNGHWYFGIVVLIGVVLPAPRGAVSMGETRWQSM